MSKKYSILAAFLVVSVSLGGCLGAAAKGSGDLITVEKEYSGFDKVKVGYGCKLTLRQSDRYSVIVRVDDNLADRLKIELDGSTLLIGMKSGYSYRRLTLEADITMPDIQSLRMSGGSDGTIEGFNSERSLSVDLSGGSELVGEVGAGDFELSISGGSELELHGSADDLSIKGSGGSGFDLSGMNAEDATVSLSGGSTATINVNGSISGSLSGGSVVHYLGDPSLGSLKKSGGSAVVRK
jgi:hypothetical protein